MRNMETEGLEGAETISVMVADSNQMQVQLLVTALRRRQDLKVASCALEVEAILRAIKTTAPQVVILSSDCPKDDSSPMTVLQYLHLSYPNIPKILLIDKWQPELVTGAFLSGARGVFCFADHPFRLLCKCIRCVHQGEIWINSEQLNNLLREVRQVPSIRKSLPVGAKQLTPREEQVVGLVAGGYSNRQTARQLALSENTVKKYLFHIFEKLGVSNRVELVLYAVAGGETKESPITRQAS